MGTRSIKRVVVVALVTSATVLGTIEAAVAEPFTLPAGVACEFPLTVDADPDTRKKHVIKEFVDNNGNPVTVILTTGRGSAITLTNDDTGATLSLPASGAPQRQVLFPNGPGNLDDTSTFTTMGHLVLILFPTDVPAGPSTTLREAERELDAATTRTALDAAARKLMRAKAELKRGQGQISA